MIDDRATRRTFLSNVGMGFAGVALGAMLHHDGIARAGDLAVPDGRPHFAPRVKNVIWIFMVGGVSHVEGFDPKPELNRLAGKTIAETPYGDALKSRFTENVRIHVPNDANGHIRQKLYPLQVGFRKRGNRGPKSPTGGRK